jgi:lipid-binding SYLF domain-containing protein
VLAAAVSVKRACACVQTPGWRGRHKDSAQHALLTLYKSRPVAEVVSKQAKAILVFPKVLKAGAESCAYFVFLMSDKAVRYLEKSKGWELGVGPSLVIVNEGVAKNLSTSTLKDDAYAFISDQQGLMASLSIEGTKISRIKR